MSLIAQIGTVVLSSLLGGIVSYFVSKRVAADTAEKQYSMDSRRNRLEWHKKTRKLASLVEEDWFEVVTQSEAEYEVDDTDIFITRRDELREHAAEGKALNIDFDITQRLDQLAAELNVALNELDSGKQLAEIETSIQSEVDSLITETEERIQELS